MPNETADALDLEAEALEYPDDRGEILMEAAAAWRRAGDDLRATTLLEGLIAEGGEDGCYARVELAAQLLDDGRLDDALARLADLARDPALHDGHCQWAAELLAEHGQHREALRWYDRLVARLAPQRLDAVRGADGWLAMESMALRGRREVRRELGLPADATDEIVPDPPEGGLGALLDRAARRSRHTSSSVDSSLMRRWLPGVMARERMSVADLMASARETGVRRLTEVDLAVLETDGKVSFFTATETDRGAPEKPSVG